MSFGSFPIARDVWSIGWWMQVYRRRFQAEGADEIKATNGPEYQDGAEPGWLCRKGASEFVAGTLENRCS